MRASASNAPGASEQRIWLQYYQSIPGPKAIRWARHGLDGKAAPVDVGKRVAGEDHQVGVALVDPEAGPCSAIQIPKFDTSKAILVPLEVGERVVERCLADPPWLSEIVLCVLDAFRARRQAALVTAQDSPRGYAQSQRIDGQGTKGQVRMSSAPEGTSFVPTLLRRA
jgi:hypothetical protein